MDEMTQRQLLDIDAIEQRLDELTKRVDGLSEHLTQFMCQMSTFATNATDLMDKMESHSNDVLRNMEQVITEIKLDVLDVKRSRHTHLDVLDVKRSRQTH